MTTPPLTKPRLLPLSSPNAILVVVSLAHAVNHAYSTLMPLIYPFVVSEFRLSYSDIGIMVGVASAASGLLQMVYSYLSGRIVRRVLLGGGQLLMAASTAGTALVNQFGLFFLGNLFARIGGSPQHPVGNSMLSDHFEPHRRGFALSAHVSGGNVGTVVVPLIGTFLITAFNWRITLVVFAIVALIVALVLVFVIDETTQADTNAAPRTRGSWKDIRTVLADRNVRLIFVASIVAAGGRGLGVLLTYIPLYLQNALRLDPTLAGVLFTILLIGSVVGPILFGRVSDTRGRRPILLGIYAASAIATVVFTLVGETWYLLAISLLVMGIVVYAESPLLQTFLADSTQHLDRDLAFGLYFTVVFGVGSFWATVLGWVIDTYGFAAGFHVMTASYLLAGLVLLPAREIHP